MSSDFSVLRELIQEESEGCNACESGRLLMLAGLPGSGKTTLAKNIVDIHPSIVIESDQIRKTLFTEPQYTREEHGKVFNLCHRLLDYYLEQNYPVIFDATNTTHRSRRGVLEIAEKRNAPILLVEVVAPQEVIIRRLKARESGYTSDTFSDAGIEIYKRMAKSWQNIHEAHIKQIRVDTSKPLRIPLQQIAKWYQKVGQQ